MSEKASAGRGHKISPMRKGSTKIAYSLCPKSDPNTFLDISASTQNGNENFRKISIQFLFSPNPNAL